MDGWSGDGGLHFFFFRALTCCVAYVAYVAYVACVWCVVCGVWCVVCGVCQQDDDSDDEKFGVRVWFLFHFCIIFGSVGYLVSVLLFVVPCSPIVLRCCCFSKCWRGTDPKEISWRWPKRLR